MIIGYARQSYVGDSLFDQVQQLKQFGCHVIYKKKDKLLKDAVSIRNDSLSFLNQGDTLVVSSLDRLGLTLKELLDMISLFQEKNIHFYSLKECLDTVTSEGKKLLQVMTACCEMERSIMIDRTRNGVEIAKIEGRVGGRPEVHDDTKKSLGYQIYLKKEKSVGVIASELGMSRATLYRYIEKKQQ